MPTMRLMTTRTRMSRSGLQSNNNSGESLDFSKE
jgi:hypothetical protein